MIPHNPHPIHGIRGVRADRFPETSPPIPLLNSTARVFRTENRRAFTLMELMVVITIIGILSSMSMLVITGVQRSSRASQTEAMIQRLDAAISDHYESYTYRRIDVPRNLNVSPVEIAKIRRHFLLDTMRMEMPGNWYEALRPQAGYPSGNFYNRPNSDVTAPDSALRRTYQLYFEQAVKNVKDDQGFTFQFDGDGFLTQACLDELAQDEDINEILSGDSAPAKLLYLIVMNVNPETRELFSNRGVSTSPKDGLPYFVDGWDRPIYFLRWAPGFSGSQRQPDMWKWTGTKANQSDNAGYWVQNFSPDNFDAFTTPANNDYRGQTFQMVREQYPDPLDPIGMRGYTENRSTSPPVLEAYPGWTLFPLIYSAGPDGNFNIAIPASASGSVVLDPFAGGYGAPFGSGGGHADNIHNHTLSF